MIEEIRGIGGPNHPKGIYGKKAEKFKRRLKLERESLEISGKAFVQSVLKKSREVPEIRQKLVEQLKRAIESGDYVVDVKNMARRMLGGE